MRLIFQRQGFEDRTLESQEICPNVGDSIHARSEEMDREPIRGTVAKIEWTLETKMEAQAIVTLV
jgi:hypothetical protein